jgi:hypothetical protein
LSTNVTIDCNDGEKYLATMAKSDRVPCTRTI